VCPYQMEFVVYAGWGHPAQEMHPVRGRAIHETQTRRVVRGVLGEPSLPINWNPWYAGLQDVSSRVVAPYTKPRPGAL
jgi:hypothetical protein